MKYYFAVDMGGTNIKLGIVNDEGKILYKDKIPTLSDLGSDKILDRIEESFREILEKNDLTEEEIEGIGFCCPGPLNPETGIIYEMPNVPGWNNFPLLERVQEKFSHVKTKVDNDANAAALGEWWIGGNQNSKNLVFYTLGTGVGGGLILNGKLFHGSQGVAAELGHVTILPYGAVCGCGNRGCLEALASGSAIVRTAKEELAKYPESSLADIEELTPKTIFHAAKEGDALAKKIYENVGMYLGIAIAGVLNMLNPDTIVLGGGVAAAHKFFMPTLKKEIRKRAFQIHRETATIKISELGAYAGLIGAAGIVKFDE